MNNIKTIWIQSALDEHFKPLFKAYFKEFGLDMPEQGFMAMDRDVQAYDMKIVMLYQSQEPIGFCLFQIDTLDNPWCMHEGAGDIREFYIKPSHRKKNLGTYLFHEVRQYFLKENVKDIYLTSDDTGDFWKKLGFVFTGKIIEENNSEEYHLKL